MEWGFFLRNLILLRLNGLIHPFSQPVLCLSYEAGSTVFFHLKAGSIPRGYKILFPSDLVRLFHHFCDQFHQNLLIKTNKNEKSSNRTMAWHR